MGEELIPLFHRVLTMDALALASPIYTMGITAEMKGFPQPWHSTFGTEVTS